MGLWYVSPNDLSKGTKASHFPQNKQTNKNIPFPLSNFLARSTEKTKEVRPRLIVGGQRSVAQRSQPRPPCTAEQGGQRRQADAGSEEDRRQDGDPAQRVRGHHHHRGVHRSG